MAIEMLDLEAAREEIASGAKLIDVREQNEWDESHIDEAAARAAGRAGRAPRRGRPRHLGAPRCCTAAPTTAPRRWPPSSPSLGYENVGVVEGGIVAWEDAGLPTVNASGLTESSGCATRATPCSPRSGSRAS